MRPAQKTSYPEHQAQDGFVILEARCPGRVPMAVAYAASSASSPAKSSTPGTCFCCGLDGNLPGASQVDQSYTRRVGGLGRGLTVARDLARLLGGDLVLDVNSDRGSLFPLTLPKSRPEQSPSSSRLQLAK